jgi:hypothetical protein
MILWWPLMPAQTGRIENTQVAAYLGYVAARPV